MVRSDCREFVAVVWSDKRQAKFGFGSAHGAFWRRLCGNRSVQSRARKQAANGATKGGMGRLRTRAALD
jgi:hypothetical protein